MRSHSSEFAPTSGLYLECSFCTWSALKKSLFLQTMLTGTLTLLLTNPCACTTIPCPPECRVGTIHCCV